MSVNSIIERDKLEKWVDRSSKAFSRESLRGARHMIWDAIIEVIFTYWNSCVIENDELELITNGGRDIKVVKKELENKPNISCEVIKYLNSKNFRVEIARGKI